MRDYRFYVKVGDAADIVRMYPVYGSGLSLEWKKETDQRFFRAELSDSLTFMGADYDTITGAAFGTVFHVYLMQRGASGEYTQIFGGKFTITDCEVDVDGRTVTVKPETEDDYTELMDGWEREYDIIPLAPECDPVQVTKRPLLQFYSPGDTVVSCYLDGMTWDMDANVVTTNLDTIQKTWHFGSVANTLARITLPEGCGQLPAGEYVAGTALGQGEQTVFSGPNGWKLYYYQEIDQLLPDGKRALVYRNGFFYCYNNDFSQSLNHIKLYEQQAEYTYKTEQSERVFIEMPQYVPLLSEDPRDTWSSTGTYEEEVDLYARQVLDLEELEGGTSTYAIDDNDICMSGGNYKRVIAYSRNVQVMRSETTQDEPTEWGKSPQGGYYVKPRLFPSMNDNCYPVGRNMWGRWSLWYFPSAADTVLEETARSTYTLRDAYPLSSVLSVLLKEIAPGITHGDSPEFSEILYGEPADTTRWRFYVAPKTNVTKSYYSQPAQTAKTTLKKFLDMLAKAFKLYAFVDGGKLRIEHVRWFKNGGTYDGTAPVSYDLTAMENLRNGKAWSWGQSRYDYEKEEMPERYEFGWMDESTRQFDGWPIVMRSPVVMQDKKEEIDVADFTSNVDYMLLVPDDIADDGFALLGAVRDDAGAWSLPMVDFMNYTDGGYRYTNILQNGYMAFCMIHQSWWLYDLPCREVTVNGRDREALGVSRRKKQTVSFPAGYGVPDTRGQIMTGLGSGEIETLTLDLQSKSAEAELRYDTE